MMGLRLCIDEKHIEGREGCLFAVCHLAVSFGFYALAAWGAQYAADGLLRAHLPFWPLFVGLLVLGFLFEKAAPKKSLVAK